MDRECLRSTGPMLPRSVFISTTTALVTAPFPNIHQVAFIEGRASAVDQFDNLILATAPPGSGPPPTDPFVIWQNTYFTVGQLADPNFSGPNADPFGKGISNTNQFL